MAISDILYRAAVAAAVPAIELVSPLNARLHQGVLGRRASLRSLEEWAERERSGTHAARPLLWLHAPSVGEALMAQAVLAAARRRVPDVQSVFTYFSPSAERVAGRVGADWAGYLPWDRASTMRRLVGALQPDAVAFVRTEIWPALTLEGKRAGAGVLLVNAALAPDSSRVGAPARLLLGPAYRRLDAVAAVHEEDARRFRVLGVMDDRLHVTGDARFDQVAARVAALDREAPLLRALRDWGEDAVVLVAGSTWPADDALLVPALAATRQACRVRAVMAPHEPTPAHLGQLEHRLTAEGMTHMRLGAWEAGQGSPVADVIVIDRVGVLADVYSVADLAYVGGGFGTAGLHSVVEPAALGVPVICGPRHGNAREAARLAAAGGARVVPDGNELLHALHLWCGDGAARHEAGAAAAAWVEAGRGSAEGAAELLERWLR